VIDDFAKDYLHRQLKVTREALVWKLDGLSEYDIRRPLTATGTNLLELGKHLATWEARYLGEIFDRPFPEQLPRWQDADGGDLRVTPDETRDQMIGFTSTPGSMLTRRSQSFPLMPAATCRGGRVPTCSCST
jgi:hypothetical protein